MSLEYLPAKLGAERQLALLGELRAVMDEAPLFTPDHAALRQSRCRCA